jgi:hypothetical protein
VEERVFALLFFQHVAGLHVQELVVEKECPHVRWWHLEFLMVFSDVSSSLACYAPCSDVATREWSMAPGVAAKWVSTMGLDSAFVWNARFAEVATNSAAFVFYIRQGFEWFNEPWPVLLGGPPVNWHVGRICCVQFTQVKWREIVLIVGNVVRVS